MTPLAGRRATAMLAGLLISCEPPAYPSSLWDEDQVAVPTPTISGVSPAEGTISGVGLVTLMGDGFSTIPDSNQVHFDGLPSEVLSAARSQLVVKAPDINGDSLTIAVTVAGALGFSFWENYKLEEAVSEFGGFGKTDDKDADNAYGMAVDLDENLYVSLITREVHKVTPAGERSVYATSTVLKFDVLRMGPGGMLYAGGGRRSVYRVPPGGGQAQAFGSFSERVTGLDFDDEGNLYASGKGAKLFRLNPGGETSLVAEYSPGIEIKAIRVFDGFVYAAGDYAGGDTNAVQAGIWRNELVPGEGQLGTAELVFDWGAFAGPLDAELLDFTFAADGEMILSSSEAVGLYLLSPPYVGQPPAQFYPELAALEAPISTLSWGNGRYLYINHPSTDDNKRTIKRVIIIKAGATYYGRQ